MNREFAINDINKDFDGIRNKVNGIMTELNQENSRLSLKIKDQEQKLIELQGQYELLSLELENRSRKLIIEFKVHQN